MRFDESAKILIVGLGLIEVLTRRGFPHGGAKSAR